ncbi:A/G-specific adenine glycosylase [Hujiaoplasma nucleasis]|uniref:Adenine DNA glycosylase n=1 Tax=Hujiaoplasma nucleasis TaxID=2725268 RepID=A0A7L6N3M7_9MOLU|nr:A/G-specific adenine glycosylase [Hujiaoplasma nucleasis]QLY40866.1 A/G-specific adenine glycosylase [Hujiaoplasma nucleasis]
MNINKLENWYADHHRKLPFRETKDPYHIWVSEVMLQQTQVETVIPYFERFIKRLPSIHDLAAIEEEKLFSLIQGLGYYRRFKNLHKAAKIVVTQHKGIFPSSFKEVRKLPGIGDYTAGAIMSIAYNKPYNATDGNVIRVLSRLMNINDDMRIDKNKKQITAINQSFIEKANPNIYTQAIMELGALICRPIHPKCKLCPLNSECLAYKNNLQNTLPNLSKKPEKKLIQYKVFIIRDNNYLYLRKRKEKLLGGMYEFPQFEEDLLPFDYHVIKVLGHKKHIFTHLIWEMKALEVKLISEPLDEWIKISIDDLKLYPMATAHKKIANLL